MTLASSANITTDYDMVIILEGRSFMYIMGVWAREFALVEIKIFFVPQSKKNTAHHYNFILTFCFLSIRIRSNMHLFIEGHKN
jgi:hypothetical protein